MGLDSSVGIATRCRLDGPRMESRLAAKFSATVQTVPGAHPASHTMGTGSFQGAKRPGRGVDHPLPSSTEVKERVGIYFYSLSGTSWPVLGWTLPLPYVLKVPVPVAARSKAWVCGRSPAVGLNPIGGMDVCLLCCLLSGRGLCNELITRLEESYRLWCVVVCELETS